MTSHGPMIPDPNDPALVHVGVRVRIADHLEDDTCTPEDLRELEGQCGLVTEAQTWRREARLVWVVRLDGSGHERIFYDRELTVIEDGAS